MKQTFTMSQQMNALTKPVSALVLLFSFSVLGASSYALTMDSANTNTNTNTSATLQKTPIAQALTEAVSDKKIITHDVYANWRSIQGSVLSRDGQWLAYGLIGQESNGEVVIKNLKNDQEWRYARGNNPLFSHDGKYVAFAIAPTRAALDKAKKDKTKPDDMPKPSLGVMDLSTGKTEVVERVKKFAFPEDGGNWLAVLLEAKNAAKKDGAKETEQDQNQSQDQSRSNMAGASAAGAKKKDGGTELIIWDVANAKKHHFNDVVDALWSKDGSKLAYSVSIKEPNKDGNKDGNKKSNEESVKEAQKESNKEANKAANKAMALKKEGKSQEPTLDAIKADVSIVAGKAQENKNIGSTEPKIDYAASEGVYLFMTADATSKALLQGAGAYKKMSFDEAGKQLAFVTDRDVQVKIKAAKQAKEAKKIAENSNKNGTKNDTKSDNKNAEEVDVEADLAVSFNLYYWNDTLNTAQRLVSPETAGMPAAWAPSEHGNIDFSKDGQRLFFGTAETPKVTPKNTPEPMKVDLWSWKDPELQSMQKVRAEREKNRNYLALVHLADQRFVQLANKNVPDVIVNDNAQFAMGVSNMPYRQLMSWDGNYVDAYTINLATGEAKQVIQKSRFMPSLSPAGKFILGFDANTYTWFSYANADGKKTNLTGKIKVHFEDVQRDTPDFKDAYGVAGWTADDASVVIYDQFDLWEINMANQAHRNLSAGFGRKNKLELRYVNLEAEKKPSAFQLEAGIGAENKPLPSDAAWVLSATNDVNKSTGYYQLDVHVRNGASSNLTNLTNLTPSSPVRLIHADKLISGLIKAKDSNAIVFTQQTFTEFPDLWSADLSFSSPKKVSYANPQQAQYNWGTQEMVEYTSKDGKKLKALIAKPENFDPKKKYPMMVYIYENMTDNMYRYVPPSPAQNINVTRYVSNGYIVLRPDIVYKTGYPGKSAMNTVVPAVEQTIARGYVDSKRVGIQGHSWGAYQISYLITHTNIFRAAEAGASMANMISGYGGIRWGTGMSRAFQYEKQQSRIGGTPWDSTDKYIENSPIFKVDKVQTPFLTVHNDDDDAVPFYQAIEFFTALRRLNKEAYWFNYNGEKHGLRDRDNIKHFTVHMSEYFDHFLLNKPRPDWMDNPVPYLERGKRDVMGMFKTKEADSRDVRKEEMR